MFKRNRQIYLILLFAVLCVSFLIPGTACSQRNRESWQPPGKIMDAVGVKPGMIIGEAGAGTGYFTFPLAERVGEKGKIYANDISRSSLDKLKSRAERERVRNIETVVGKLRDPSFPVKDLDMIIMVYVLHHLDEPVDFVKNLKKYLKPGARLVIIERDAEKDRSGSHDFMSKTQALETMKKTGFELDRTEDFLKYDTIYIYKIRK
ncbi:class I SAM-dependent methyltransferase [candidate division KSB1 bacterium]